MCSFYTSIITEIPDQKFEINTVLRGRAITQHPTFNQTLANGSAVFNLREKHNIFLKINNYFSN